MDKLKSFFKRFSFFYSVHDCIQEVKKIFIIALVKIMGKFVNQTCDIPVLKALKHISDIREETEQNYVENSLCIDSQIDLSIIVPIYNAERFLEKCLDSIQKQVTNYRYEVICINDGSTDESCEILKKYENDSKFIIYHQSNRGHSGARNQALDFVLGKYLMFVDSDDFINENYVESLLKKAYETSSDIVQSNYCKCNAESRILKQYLYEDKVYAGYMDYACFSGAPWGRIYRSSLWNGVRFPEGMMFEDAIIFNVVFRRCNYITVCSKANYYYRIYGNNTINKLRDDPRRLDAVWSVKYSLELSSHLGIQNTFDYYEFLLWQCSRHVYYRTKRFPIVTQKMCFIIMCDIIHMYKQTMIDNGVLHDALLIELDKCFSQRNFWSWKTCSKIYK